MFSNCNNIIINSGEIIEADNFLLQFVEDYKVFIFAFNIPP